MEPANPVQERRSVERVVLKAPLSADAIIGDRHHQVTIIDFSNVGAKIQAADGASFGPYAAGQLCEFLIHLPTGSKLSLKASLSWSFRLPEGSLMGVQFTGSVDTRLLREIDEGGTD